MNSKKDKMSLILTYLELRRAIGALGILFPFILLFGAIIIFHTGMQSSISAYYHTGMRDVFVGTLWTIGFFLYCYKGYKPYDNIACNLSGIFAVGVALFPATPDIGATGNDHIIGYIHFAFAALFFISLICISWFLFTKTKEGEPRTNGKKKRNMIYILCGCIMAACILFIAVYSFFLKSKVPGLKAINPIYWLETIAVLAFGLSWVTKGRGDDVVRLGWRQLRSRF